MGLQATSANKRKHEINFNSSCSDNTDNNSNNTSDCKNCPTPPPLKASKWSIKNNNYLEAIENEMKETISVTDCNGGNKSRVESLLTITVSSNNMTTSGTQNVSSDVFNDVKDRDNYIRSRSYSKNKNSDCIGKGINEVSNNNADFLTIPKKINNIENVSTATSILPAAVFVASEAVVSSTPLPTITDNSVPKLEVVKAGPLTATWPTPTVEEPIDCISKLQAVLVPSNTWYSTSTHSTLATKLLSVNELNDEDDGFEEDYEEEHHINPAYCISRYRGHSTDLTNTPPSNTDTYLSSYSSGYNQNNYPEPPNQPNCNSQNIRIGGEATKLVPTHWPIGNNTLVGKHTGAHPQCYVVQPQFDYMAAQQQQQQTIRCAENGKYYLELGGNNPSLTKAGSNWSGNVIDMQPSTSINNMYLPSGISFLDARNLMKQCCDKRGTWCSTNGNCYKEFRLKIRNLSMFKLSRFRQVAEQSLYRSVLICNTLKRIDREINADTKDVQHVMSHSHDQQNQNQQQSQYHKSLSQLHHHLQVQTYPHHNHTQAQQGQQYSTLHRQQLHNYLPVMNCTRLSNTLEYQVHQSNSVQQHQIPQQQQILQQQHARQQSMYNNHFYRLETSYLTSQAHSLLAQKSTNNFTISSCSNCDSISPGAANAILHPYDHYPFREIQHGRTTPFPCHSDISATVPSTSLQTHSATTLLTTSSSCTPTTLAAVVAASPVEPTTTTSSGETLTTISVTADNDSGYVDDQSISRSINWSSVLRLSSQSALDPLNNDLFSISPPEGTTMQYESNSQQNKVSKALAISGTFTKTTTNNTTRNSPILIAVSSAANATLNLTSLNSSTTTTFTTLSTISSATHSFATASYVSSISSNAICSPTSTWEYEFLDMEFGLGTEFTDIVPNCKLSSDDMFKSGGLAPKAAVTSRYSSIHDNELERPAHIMVGS